MFWEKNKIQEKQNDIEEPKRDSSTCSIPILKRETTHVKTIIGGKLYDTEKAERLSGTEDNRTLFVTRKGNYFSCEHMYYNYMKHEGEQAFDISVTSFSNIRPESLEYAMTNIGRYNPEKYIELFGEVEEA